METKTFDQGMSSGIFAVRQNKARDSSTLILLADGSLSRGLSLCNSNKINTLQGASDRIISVLSELEKIITS
jgi:hypothetical protein